MRQRIPATVFVAMSFIIQHVAFAHPADQSEMRVRPSPHSLEIRLTFNILTLTRFVQIETDGDAKVSMAELEAAQPALVEYLNRRIRLDINQKTAALGSNVNFSYLWPDAQATPPMTDFEYAARNVDVTFVVPVVGRLLEDFWIGFEIFEETGPMQTIRGLYELNGQIEEVPFSGQEPEYTYDTGFAEDPFVQAAEKAHSVSSQPTFPFWIALFLAAATTMGAWRWNER